MKKVLIIAYQFPPMGGSGVQRTSKFVKYLRDFDLEPVVLTRTIGKMPLRDETLLQDIPGDVKVYRYTHWDVTEWPGPFQIAGKIIARKILIPDGERLWELSLHKKVFQILDQESIDTIYSTSYPYSDHLLALHVKTKRPEIKWIADFRDEWTNNPYTLDNPHSVFRTKKEKQMEQAVLMQADRLITNTPVMMRNFIASRPDCADKFHVIPNGYDTEDFENLPVATPDTHKLVITYTGALYGRRKPEPFFKALASLIRQEKIEKDKIEVRLIGNYIKKRIDESIQVSGLPEGIVHILGYLPHDACIQKQMESTVLLLLEGDGPGADAFYTGKVFEYMNTNRVVLGIIPKGACWDLMEKTRIGILSLYSDPASIEESILSLYSQWENGTLSFNPDWTEIKKYERRALTAALAEVLRLA